MIDVRAEIDKEIERTKLEILVFGPAIDPPSPNPHTASLQLKRREIKRRLIEEGHSASFAEDIVDPSLPAPLADPLLQEIAAMRAADLIVILVYSPGSILEAKTITGSKELCPKAAFYCFEDHKGGLVVQHLQHMVAFGVSVQLVSLADVKACHLTGAILEKVLAIQIAKAFLF